MNIQVKVSTEFLSIYSDWRSSRPLILYTGVFRFDFLFLNRGSGPRWPGAHPEAAVVLHHRVGEVDPLAAPHELPHLGVVVQADVVAHKVTVQAVPPALLLVQEDVRG